MRVLYSFPHKLGADRICYIAWQQVRGLAAAGVQILAMPGVLQRPVPHSVRVEPTLARGRFRIPYRLLGRMNSCRLHDWIVARRLEAVADQIDLVHCWPLAALETLNTAKRLGIPTVLERPNAHTRFCYDTVAAERQRIGIKNPHHEYIPDERVLAREEQEFDAAFQLLCASDFALQTFLNKDFAKEVLLRHTYGFDEARFAPASQRPDSHKFTALFVGVDAVRKGLHIALHAWLASPASRTGRFLIAGDLSSEYKSKFARELSDHSVIPLGHRTDVPHLMRTADVLLMPSIEEGFALVCVEALGSGCVPVVSGACTEICQHMHNALVHPIGDTQALARHITLLYENPSLLHRLRETCIAERLNYTWTAAGRTLQNAYQIAIERYHASGSRMPMDNTSFLTSGIVAN